VIVAVGPAGVVSERHPDLPVRDLGEVILAPGFVDAHCHTEWSLTGGVAAGPGFGRWLERFLAAVVRSGWGGHRAAADLAVLTALRAGTTTLCDSGPTGAGVAAVTSAGLRGIVCLEAFGDDPASARVMEERVAALADAAGPLVRAGVSPHAPYSVGPRLWAALAERPGLADVAWSTHLAESEEEARGIGTGEGPLVDALATVGAAVQRWPGDGPASPVGRLGASGALRAGLVAAHCVRTDGRDARVLAAAGVGVAHCPVSNSRLGCGRMPLELLWEAGVTVGLGTDSPASAGEYDVRAEARACEVLHGGLGAPADPARLVALATIEGARVLGLDHLVGSLEPGKAADLVAVRPAVGAAGGDPYAALLRADSAVVGTWVGGRETLRDGVPVHLDPERIVAVAEEARRILC